MEYVRARTIVITGLVLVLVAALAVVTLRVVLRPGPGCTTALGDGAGTVTVEQADSAATIAGVGMAMGMPDHAVTVALATAMQESGLRNLPGGDRDSAGLFQQRPSQGWGTLDQVTDPVYAATAFYAKLRTEPDWPTLSVTEAAQLVQRSATPEAYARWEPMARSLARALTGEDPAAMTCHELTLSVPGEDVATVAAAELGTSRLSGPQPAEQAAEGPEEHPGPGTPLVAGVAGAERAEDHHALNADVHHAGAFGPQARQTRQRDRGGRGDRGLDRAGRVEVVGAGPDPDQRHHGDADRDDAQPHHRGQVPLGPRRPGQRDRKFGVDAHVRTAPVDGVCFVRAASARATSLASRVRR